MARAERIGTNREEALRRRTRRQLIIDDFNNPEGDLQDEEPEPDQHEEDEEKEEPMPPEPELPAELDEQPIEPPPKRNKITGKQKYAAATEEHRKQKKASKEEWIEHGSKNGIAASTSQSFTPRRHYKSIDRIIDVTNEQRGPKVGVSSVAATAPFADEVHPSHHKMLLRNILFCESCGYWSSEKTQKLTEPCPLKPPHSDGRAKLNRLLNGHRPDRKVKAWNDGLSTSVKIQVASLDEE